jgi:hypothetical protein
VVGTSCAGSEIAFTVDVEDPADEIIEARWFVDYAPEPPNSLFKGETVAPPQGDVTRRTLTPFRLPLSSRAPGEHQLVEVVVSNGFFPPMAEPPGLEFPSRTPLPGFETQVFRWVVGYEQGAPCP